MTCQLFLSKLKYAFRLLCLIMYAFLIIICHLKHIEGYHCEYLTYRFSLGLYCFEIHRVVKELFSSVFLQNTVKVISEDGSLSV